MERKTMLVLVAITAIGIVIRLFPTLKGFAIGNDFGIYYTILQDFVKSGSVIKTFKSPWGGAGYGDFPVMYWIIIAIWKATGLNYTELLIKIPPIFGGLTPIIIFAIAKKVSRSNLTALIASAFDAVNPILVFQTSLSSILVFGHFFGLLMMLFLILYIDDGKYFVPAIAMGMLMVASHPLSTYIYLIGSVGIAVVFLYKDPTIINRRKFAMFLYPISIFTFAFWYAFFPQFKGFLSGGLLHLPPLLVIAGFFSLVTLIIFFPYSYIRLILQRLPRINIARKKLLISTLAIYMAASAMVLPLLVLVLPSFTIADAFTMIPLLMDGAIAIVGLYAVSGKMKNVLVGWLFLLFASFLYSVATWNMVLYPGRYFEYLFEPLSILDAAGIVYILSYAQASVQHGILQNLWHNPQHGISSDGFSGIPLVKHLHRASTTIKIALRKNNLNNARSFAVIGLLVVVLTASAATPYQVGKTVTPSGNQSINIPDYRAALWLDHNASRNYSVATDHILGLLLDGYNLTGTFESIDYLWNQTSILNSSLHELMGDNYSTSLNYSHVGYVLIDNYMLSNGVWGYDGLSDPYIKPIAMTNLSMEKFLYEPFYPVYFNSTASGSWALVLEVNWTFLDMEYHLDIQPIPYEYQNNYSRSYILDTIFNHNVPA